MRRILGVMLVVLLGFSVTRVYAQQHQRDKHKHAMGEITIYDKGESSGICPVMKGAANKEYSHTYNGKAYNFCCSSCIEEFKKDPEKYVSKIKEINLEVFQFNFSPSVITVKKGDIVKLYVTSRDVSHGIYIKEYNINTSVKKDKPEKIEIIADKTGEFDIICSIYCGRGHSQMRGKLIVEE